MSMPMITIECPCDALRAALTVAMQSASELQQSLWVFPGIQPGREGPYNWAISEARPDLLCIEACPSTATRRGGFIFQLKGRPRIEPAFDDAHPETNLLIQLETAAHFARYSGRDFYVYGNYRPPHNDGEPWRQRAWLHFTIVPADDPYIQITPEGVATFEIDL